MRTLITGLMASALIFAGVSVANAADAVDQVPEAPVANDPVKPVGSWEGFYLGGAATYNIGGDQKYNMHAIGGQLFSGYNWQSGQIVYGVEGDVGYSGNDGAANGGTLRNGVNGSLRGRVGYDLNPFLLYGTAGVALSNNKFSTGAGSDERAAFGYTVGAGAEAMVTNNITARIEYRYTDYQNKDFDIGSSTFSRGYDEHSVKVGLGVKF